MKLKKLLAVLLCAAVLISAFFTLCSAGEKQTQYLVLGDSIGYGAGVANPAFGAFGRIVADTDGFGYTNDAVSGHTSADLLSRLSDPTVASHVANADIISVSIGGNDFMRITAKLIADARKGDMTRFEQIKATFETNFDKIVTRLRALSPDCVIVAQTLYNPAPTESTRQLYDAAISRVNDVITSYPGILVSDMAAAFAGRNELIAADNVHPNAEGNVVIARTVLKTLYDNGLGTETEPVITVPGRNWAEPAGASILTSIRVFFVRIIEFFRRLFRVS